MPRGEDEIVQLLRPDEVFDAQIGYDIVRTLLIDKLG